MTDILLLVFEYRTGIEHSRLCVRGQAQNQLARRRRPLYDFSMQRIFSIAFAIVVAFAAAAPGVARADQKDPRLDVLFAELQKVTGTLQGRTLTQQIWAIWIASDNPEVNRLMSEGTDAMAVQDYKTALADFTKMITIAPDFAEGWNKRATVLWLLNDYEGSMADVGKTLALEPRHFGALWGLGAIDAALEHDEEAIAAFEKALAVNPHLEGVTEQIEALKQRIKDKQI
jgi:tetratricopeptide (TPR) repeat protein